MFEEFGDALAFCHGLYVEAVGCHHSAVVVLMRLAELNKSDMPEVKSLLAKAS